MSTMYGIFSVVGWAWLLVAAIYLAVKHKRGELRSADMKVYEEQR